jgi:hypothetical protein
MSTSKLTTRVIELQKQQYNFVPDSCPEGITFEMLMEEISPEENYEKSDKNRNELWTTYYIVCLNPNPFGFYIDKHEINKSNENIIIPWYKLESEGKK